MDWCQWTGFYMITASVMKELKTSQHVPFNDVRSVLCLIVFKIFETCQRLKLMFDRVQISVSNFGKLGSMATVILFMYQF